MREEGQGDIMDESWDFRLVQPSTWYIMHQRRPGGRWAYLGKNLKFYFEHVNFEMSVKYMSENVEQASR